MGLPARALPPVGDPAVQPPELQDLILGRWIPWGPALFPTCTADRPASGGGLDGGQGSVPRFPGPGRPCQHLGDVSGARKLPSLPCAHLPEDGETLVS